MVAGAVEVPAPFETNSFPMATITKRELVIKVSNETGLTQQQVFDVIQRTMDSIVDALANGDAVVMRNFGAFQVKESKAKIGRNPKNPARDVPIPPRAMVKFKPGKEMKEKVAQVLPKIREQQVG
jgi:nucleoid DNA-binding protein